MPPPIKYPVYGLKPGEVVVIPCEPCQKKRIAAQMYNIAWRKKWKFRVLQVPGGVKVRRVA